MGEYGLGLDLGSRFTAAAITAGGAVEAVRLGGRRSEIPTAVFLRPDGTVLIGEAARRRGESEPDRLAGDLRARLIDPGPTRLGDAELSGPALVAQFLDQVIATASRGRGGRLGRVVLTHPVDWDDEALDALRRAAQLAGVPEVTLRSEPEAAAARARPGDLVAVYDLGATFRATVLRRTDEGAEILATEQVTGVDFDRILYEHVLSRLEVEEDAPADLARLRRECGEAVESLSFDTEAEIAVDLPGLHTRLPLRRSELEDLISPALAETVAALRLAFETAGVRVDQADAVVLAGGSARIPLVGALVSAAIGRSVPPGEQPETAVAMGAARLSLPGADEAISVAFPAVMLPRPDSPSDAFPAFFPAIGDLTPIVPSPAAPGPAPVPPGAVAGSPGVAVGSPGAAVGSPGLPDSPRAVPIVPGAVGASDDPTEPGASDRSGGPVMPGASDRSDDPTEPGASDRSGGPVASGAAGQSGGPTVPGAAGQSGGPTVPGAAGQPGGPTVPGAGGESGGPAVPGAAGRSGGLAVPGAAGRSGGLAVPGASGRPAGPSASAWVGGAAVPGAFGSGGGADSVGEPTSSMGGAPDWLGEPTASMGAGWGLLDETVAVRRAVDNDPDTQVVVRRRRGWLWTYRWPVAVGMAGVVVAAAVTVVALRLPGGTPGSHGPSGPATAPVALLWKAETGFGSSEPPAVSGDRIVLGGADGQVRGYRRDDGELVWTVPVGPGVRVAAGIPGRRAYAATTDGHLVALDTTSGEIAWRRATATRFDARPLVGAGRIYAGGRDGVLYAYALSGNHTRWRVWADDRFMMTPALVGTVAVAMAADGRLYGTDRNGTPMWKPSLGSATAGPVAAAGAACLPLADGSVRCVRAGDGTMLPRINPAGVDLKTVAGGAGLVFAAGSDGSVGAWDPVSGQARWTYRPPAGSGGPGHLLTRTGEIDVAYPGGDLVGLDTRTGAVRWRYSTGDHLTAAPSGDDSGIFVLGASGTLYALRPPGIAAGLGSSPSVDAAPTTRPAGGGAPAHSQSTPSVSASVPSEPPSSEPPSSQPPESDPPDSGGPSEGTG